ncbi:unnamed protein product [Trichogramma brassicae]|uniref:Integrase zinc-binding domain-containing protein n=1 Tax=Trichogramma brassicae TaxID=86971 RepID=A0A6H5I4I1_9HYME|nr:unnamed protein product [Trichogramma brassicae]
MDRDQGPRCIEWSKRLDREALGTASTGRPRAQTVKKSGHYERRIAGQQVVCRRALPEGLAAEDIEISAKHTEFALGVTCGAVPGVDEGYSARLPAAWRTGTHNPPVESVRRSCACVETIERLLCFGRKARSSTYIIEEELGAIVSSRNYHAYQQSPLHTLLGLHRSRQSLASRTTVLCAATLPSVRCKLIIKVENSHHMRTIVKSVYADKIPRDYSCQKDAEFKRPCSIRHTGTSAFESILQLLLICNGQTVFTQLHNLSHPGARATIKLVTDRFVWPSVKKDYRNWARACIKASDPKYAIMSMRRSVVVHGLPAADRLVISSVLDKGRSLVLPPKRASPPRQTIVVTGCLCMRDTAGNILEERSFCDRLAATTESLGVSQIHQYVFGQGRSTIHAIENVFATAEEAIGGTELGTRGNKNYALVVTLDITKNAFNFARWYNITRRATRKRTPQYPAENSCERSLSAGAVTTDTPGDGPEF